MASRWRVRQFGAVLISGPGFPDGQGSAFETQRAAKILTLLALVRQGRMLREDLADALWPDDFYDATRLRLRKELSRLRQALGPASEILTTDGEFVCLERGAVDTDIDLLRRAVTTSDQDARLEARLREAAEAVAGEFLPGWGDAWAVAERNAAESLKCRVLASLGELLLARGHIEEALATVKEAIDCDPCHEGARMVAIRAHAALGSLTAAVGQYQQMKRLMRDTRDQAPSADAEALLARVQEGVSVTETPRLPELSRPLDRFFGRQTEIESLSAALSVDSPQRLVSVVGPGGIGKTRLAMEVALALRESYGGNAAFVSLAGAPSSEAAAATLLAQLGWQGAAASDPIAVVASSLPPGPCLLVLDNLEHLLPESASLVKRLLQACPSLRILATTRKSLKLTGEKIVTLGPLGAAATEMLVHLARSVRPELADDPVAVTALGTLAERLDGIPLALHLAAPRLRVIGPQALLERLGDRFRLLRGDAPDLPARHRSLRAALDGSFETLPLSARQALVKMSPFRGGWTMSHLERVMPHEDGLDTMEALVDASLVTIDDRGPTVRFGMLQTVRDYVADQESSAEARAAFVKAIAQELDGYLPHSLTPRNLTTLRALDEEVENIHLAVEIAIHEHPAEANDMLSRLWIYDTIRARQTDLVRFYDEFERVNPEIPLDAGGTFGKGLALFGLGRAEESVEPLEKTLQYCREYEDHVNVALVSAMILVAERRLRRCSLAEALSRIPWMAEQAAASEPAMARLYMLEGELLYYAGKLDDAGDRFSKALSIAQTIGDEFGAIASVQWGALIALETGNFARADATVCKATSDVVRLGDPLRMGYHLELLGRVALAKGEAATALSNFLASRQEWQRVDNVFQMADQNNSIARCLVQLNRLEEARSSAHEAFTGWTECADLGGVAVSLHTLAEIRLSEGAPETASAILAAAHAFTIKNSLEFVRSELQFVEDLTSRTGSGPSDSNPAVDDFEAFFSK